MNVSFIIPVYNEEQAVKEVVEDIAAVLKKNRIKYEILIVDDGSTDRTPEVLKTLDVRVIRHPTNQGNGAATKTGIMAAKYDTIMMTDADATYPTEDIPRMLEMMKDHDMVVGARKSEKGTMKMLRVPVKFFIRKLAEFISGHKIPDLNSGLRAFRKSDALRFFNILPNTHSWVSTITLCYLSNYYSVKYTPIDYFKRKGKSKFHPIRDTYNYTALIFRAVMYFYPLKIFIPLSLLILAFGVYRSIVHAVVEKGSIIASDIILLFCAGFVAVIGLLADLIIKATRNQYFKWNKSGLSIQD